MGFLRVVLGLVLVLISKVEPGTDSLYAVESTGWGPEPARQSSGFIPISSGGHMFYWLFESRSAHPDTDPLVIWLTGGPGCSSELAVFYECGPYRFCGDGDGSIEHNPFSWNSISNIIFIDQPRGTGFSYVDANTNESFDSDEGSIADDLYEFLVGFLESYPHFASRRLFVTGESYAGHYVPLFAHRILVGNENSADTINLAGIAIGNGWVDSSIQFEAMVDYARANDLTMNTPAVNARIDAALQSCMASNGYEQCEALENMLLSDQSVQSRDFNYYDIRIACAVSPYCYDFSELDSLMLDPSVQSALGIDPHRSSWTDCNQDVYNHLVGDQSVKTQWVIPALLTANVRVVVYSGVHDILCNHIGAQRWVERMQWSKHDEFLSASWKAWHVDGELAGRSKQTGPLTLLDVYGAGHMVPMDQPKRALAILAALIQSD